MADHPEPLDKLNALLRSSFVARAEFLAARGIPTIPLPPREKGARLKNWTIRATTDLEQIAKWQRENPESNVGAVAKPDRVCILDDDLGVKTRIERETGQQFPCTLTVKSSKGEHFYLGQTDASRKLGNRQLKISGPVGKDVTVFDFQQNDKYVVGAGSTHPSGAPYTVINDSLIVPMPDWLADWIEKATTAIVEPEILEARKKSKGLSAAEVATRIMTRPRPYTEESDRALSQELGYAHRHQADEILALFLGRSGLAPEEIRAKFAAYKLHQDRTGQYDAITIEKALLAVKEKRSDNEESEPELLVIRGSEAKREHIDYLWLNFLPKGKLAHCAGNSIEGKSPVTGDWAARTTSGADWPDGTTNDHGPRSVLLANAEDDFTDTILPRFTLAGGDPSKLYYVKATKVVRNGNPVERGVALDRDIEALRKTAKTIPDLALIIIDPVTNYLGALKMNSEEEVRSMLMPVVELARELNVAVVTVGHFNRREKGTNPMHRLMGAAAFGGVARFIYLFGPDPESENRFAHVMTQQRGVAAPSLKYHTEGVDQTWEGRTSKVVRVVWDGASAATSEDAVDPTSRQEKGMEKELADTLKEFLKDGEGKAPAECESHLKQIFPGIDGKKINWSRIRRAAGVEHKKLTGAKNKHVWRVITGHNNEIQF